MTTKAKSNDYINKIKSAGASGTYLDYDFYSMVHGIRHSEIKLKHAQIVAWYLYISHVDVRVDDCFSDMQDTIRSFCEAHGITDFDDMLDSAYFVSWFCSIYDKVLQPQDFVAAVKKAHTWYDGTPLHALDTFGRDERAVKEGICWTMSEGLTYGPDIPFECIHWDGLPNPAADYVLFLEETFGEDTIYEPMYSWDQAYRKLLHFYDGHETVLLDMFCNDPKLTADLGTAQFCVSLTDSLKDDPSPEQVEKLLKLSKFYFER